MTFQNGANGYTGTSDTRISQNAATTSYGSVTPLGVDGDDPSGTGRDVSALLRWDISSIPSGSTIQSATITLRVTDASTNSYPFFALARAWSESTATWQRASTGASWQTAGAMGATDREATSLASITASAAGSVTVTLNAAGLAKVQQWVDNPSQNFGVVLASSSNSNGLDFASREAATVADRPRLAITFVAPEPPDAGTDVPQVIDSGTEAPQTLDSGTDVGADGAGGVAGAGGTAGAGGDAGQGGTTGAAGAAGTSGGAGAGGTGGGGTGGGAGGAGTGGAGPVVVYAAGDIGSCSATGDTLTGNLLDGLLGPIVVLGDIAYNNGSASDFASCFDPPWGRHKARMLPTPGNHEYQTANAAGYFGYFGAAAGDPAKGYYSFDLGAWHVVALNSGKCSMSPPPAGGCIDAAQEQWLRADLAANPRACTLAFWHHPRFSSGSHGNLTTVTPAVAGADGPRGRRGPHRARPQLPALGRPGRQRQRSPDGPRRVRGRDRRRHPQQLHHHPAGEHRHAQLRFLRRPEAHAARHRLRLAIRQGGGLHLDLHRHGQRKLSLMPSPAACCCGRDDI